MSQFKNSIAQKNVQFPIETVVTPIAGANYSKAVIYMHSDLASAYLPGYDDPAAGDVITLNSGSFASIAGSKLLTWLTPFFKSASTAVVYVALYDTDVTGEEPVEATAPLATVYEATKMNGYFKFGLAATEGTDNNFLQVQLSNLCAPDELYSDLWVGTSDTNVLDGTSSLVTALKNADSTARVVYNPNTDINPALAQLGATLATANVTGTPVGNDIDMLAFNTISASGSTVDGEVQNLTTTQMSSLDNQKIGYCTWVGDGTENIVVEGSLDLKGNSVGAKWVKSYITYVCKVKTANLISQRNKFRNNQTYQATLLILSSQVNQFVAFGRLADFVITAPAFRDLPESGDTITVPDAWEATYIDTEREVTIYGTLYITQPTR